MQHTFFTFRTTSLSASNYAIYVACNFYFPLRLYGKQKLCAAFAIAVSVTHFSMLKQHFPQLKHCRKCTIFWTSFVKIFFIIFLKLLSTFSKIYLPIIRILIFSVFYCWILEFSLLNFNVLATSDLS